MSRFIYTMIVDKIYREKETGKMTRFIKNKKNIKNCKTL